MYEKFDLFAEKLTRNVLTYIVIIIIGFVVGFLTIYSDIDSTPATTDDYMPLLEIQDSIVERFDNVYQYDNVDIDITNDNIIIFTSNDECSINIFFDRNLNYLYTEKNDNIDCSKTMAIIATIIGSIALSAIFIFLFFILLVLLEFIISTIDINCNSNH